MASLRRREFLKMVGLAGSAAASGCSPDSGLKLIPYLVPPKDVVPGLATWYATTCLGCPAGCGVLARNRDGRVVKLEGNPLHPVNRGALCARGQAALQGLYDPDRLRGPMLRHQDGSLGPAGWGEAERLLGEWIQELRKGGRGHRVVFLTGLLTGSLLELVVEWREKLELGEHLMYEPLSYEPLSKATLKIFGLHGIPSYRMHRADLIISFGADFLGTWISPVEYARQFAAFRSGEGGHRGFFAYVGPRLSQTGANADIWIPASPSSQRLVALGILVALRDMGVLSANRASSSQLASLLNGWTLERVSQEAQVEPGEISRLAGLWASAKRPLALASGLQCVDPHAEETALLAHLLVSLSSPESLQAVDLSRLWSLGRASSYQEVRSLVRRIAEGEVDLLLVYGADPLFFLPPQWGLQEAIRSGKVRVVSFSPAQDETSSQAALLLPSSTPLESWGDWEPRQGVRGLIQPVMGNLYQTRPLGDILLSLGKKLRGNSFIEEDNFQEYLKRKWIRIHASRAADLSFPAWWVETLSKGGIWEDEDEKPGAGPTGEGSFVGVAPAVANPQRVGPEEFQVMVYPTIQLLDGREANKPWLQELPDPITQITWGSWVEVNRAEASRLGIRREELLRLETPGGSLQLPAYPTDGVAPGTLAIPMGQGRRSMGRYAGLVPGNPLLLLEPGDGGWSVCSSGVRLETTGRTSPLANTDGSHSQHRRGLALALEAQEWERQLAQGASPELRLPLPEAYDPKEDFYAPHKHVKYRWAMVVDLDRCVGCGACVVACIAENNVAIVGRKLVLEGREMHWLRIERYWEEEAPRIRFLPMLCQHCDVAPCESVCPVYAPHHSPEGLNNQVYNRCIGTRFCSQNCPYKVRRFNWFTFTRPEPLNLQLNPDVTVRQKGVMEKCSFCVQRIVEAKDRARREGRGVKDGEVTPACAQTCPTQALVFGNLMDKESRVSRLAEDVRAYQVLAHLNTKPAVIYLKRVVRKA